MHRQIAGKLTGRCAAPSGVLVFWWWSFVASTLSSPSKLSDVQDNQASSWLPGLGRVDQGAATSWSAFQDPNDIPTTVVYEHRRGAQRRRPRRPPRPTRPGSPASPASPARSTGPIPSKDGQAAQTSVTFNFGSNGWNDLPAGGDRADPRRSPRSRRDGPHRRPGRPGADSPRAFAGIDGMLLLRHPRVVILILLFTYRSPVLWLLPIFSRGGGADHRRGRDLPAGQARRAHRQRAEPGHPAGARDRRRHRLRPAAGRALPRGAASSRGPARGDGVALHRAAPAIIASAAHRRPRHALPDCWPR